MKPRLIRRVITMSEAEYIALRARAGSRYGAFSFFVWSAIREKLQRDGALTGPGRVGPYEKP